MSELSEQNADTSNRQSRQSGGLISSFANNSRTYENVIGG